MMPTDKSEMRKQMFADMEEKLFKDRKPEDSSFYYHSSEDRIVLSHALFWVMTQNIKGKMAKQKFYYNKVRCRKIERMLPALSKMVIEEQNDFAKQHPGVL